MKTYNDYAQLADDNNLKCGHVTQGSNGYPTPYAGAFIHGFDTYAQAQEFQASNGGEITLCKQKDGWQVWEEHSKRNTPLTAEDYLTDLGDNYARLTREDVFTELENIDKDIDLSDLKTELERIADWAEEIEGQKEGNYIAVIAPNGGIMRVEKEMMSYHEDVTTWTVGVFFDKEN